MFIVVDVEADGPIPGDYSMIALGATKMDDNLETQFLCKMRPISDNFMVDALAVSGYTREQTLEFIEPKHAMESFDEWLKSINPGGGRLTFVSDNNGFDWMFTCWYFHHFLGRNPFGFSSRRIGDIYCGLVKDAFAKWKHLRKTKHTHNPVDDSRGNAEALLYMKTDMGLKIKF